MAEEVKIVVSADTSGASISFDKLNKKMEETSKKVKGLSSLEKVSNTLKNVGDSVSGLGAKLSVAVTAPIVAVGKQVLDVGSSMVAFQAKYKQVFKNLTGEADKFSETMGKAVGLNPTIIKQTLTDFQAYSQGMGYTGTQALEFSKKMSTLTADLSAFSDVPITDAADRMKSALMGNYEAVDKLGLSFGEATIKQQMLRDGLKGQFSDLDETKKMQVLYNLAMYQSKDALGQAARESDSYQNSVANVKSQLSETAQSLFTLMLPAVQQVMEKVSQAIEWFNGLSDSNKRLILAIAGIVAVAGPLLFYLGLIITSISFLISPIGLVVLGIIALIAIGVLLYKNWDTICKKATELKQNVLKEVYQLKNDFIRAWSELKERVVSKFMEIKNGFLQQVEGIRNSWNNTIDSIRNKVANVEAAIKAPFARAYEFIRGIVDKIKGAFNFKLSLPSINTGGLGGLLGKLHLNADGGVFSGATLLGGGNVVGEAGTEAVLPLTKDVLGDIGAGIANSMPDGLEGGAGGENIVQNFYVNATIREEADIEKISKKLMADIKKDRRGRGRK